MANILTKIKTEIGKLRAPHSRNVPPAATGGGVPAVPAQPVPSLGGMSAEQLQARRRAMLAAVSFDVPFHRRVLNRVKNIWRIIGPFCFVLFTAWEVFYFIHSFMPPDTSWTSSALIWGITLLIEVPFMIATYDMAERKAVAVERRERGEIKADRDTLGAILLWCFLAMVNVAGQIAFLVLITRVGGNPFAGNERTTGLWFFIIVRVTGVLAGDAYTAFFLRPDESTVDRLLRTQEAQMRGEKALTQSDADRLRLEAENDATIRRIKVSVERDERESQFMSDWQTMNMQQTLERQKQFMIAERSRMREVNGVEDEPHSGDL